MAVLRPVLYSRPMRPIIALLVLAALAACQVTTSQSIGNGVSVRHSVLLNGEHATDDQTTDDQDAEATEDRMPDVTIGGGFGAGVSH